MGNGEWGMGNGEWGMEIDSTPTPYPCLEPPSNHNPQLLTMKMSSDKKVLLGKMSQDDPLYQSSIKNYQVDSNNNNLGKSNMIKEKFIKVSRRVSQSGQV